MADQEHKPKPNIDNIYYDCLERIFDFLDLESLLNVANTCKRLQIAAAAKFGDEHSQKRISFFTGSFDYISIWEHGILVGGLKMSLSFLRCFGGKILHLRFEFDWDHTNEYKTGLSQYLNQYCGDTLTSLALVGKPILSFDKPYKNLEELMIWNNFINSLPHFVDWYPNLRRLQFRESDMRADFIPAFLPHLEHLGISIRDWKQKDKIVDLLNANLQLHSLDFWTQYAYGEICLTTLLNMIRAHRSIVKMKVLESGIIVQVAAAQISQLVNEHPSMTELDLKEYQFTVADALHLIGQLHSLKRFEFCVQDEHQCDRIREQLNDEWKFEYHAKLRYFDVDGPECVIALNRNS